MDDTVSEKNKCHGQRADCERPNVPAAAVAAAGVNHQGTEESRVCLGRTVSVSAGTRGHREEWREGQRKTHVRFVSFVSEKRSRMEE